MSLVPFLSQSSFDPEMAEILASALDIAWHRGKNSRSALSMAEAAAATRGKLAKEIVAAAPTG
jgi:hypothetical protein